MNNKVIWIAVVLVVVLGGIYLVSRPAMENAEVAAPGSENEGEVARGRVIFSVTDAAANMSTISEINMSVSRVDLHSVASGWTTVSSSARSYELLKLNETSQSKILADIQAEAGVYDQVRLVVGATSVTNSAGAVREARMPSKDIIITTTMNVAANSTTSVNLDFLADKSLHTTADGEYVFAPVVKTESRSGATVNVDTAGTITVAGGRVDGSSTMGMDLDGSLKLNFELGASQRLDFTPAGGIIRIQAP